MIATVSDSLKTPMHFLTQKALGRCLPMEPDNPSYLGTLCRRVDAVAAVIFYTLLTIAYTPIWLVADLIEWMNVGNKPFEDMEPLKVPENLSLDGEKTKYLGASISTYQYTSDPDMCPNSDWHRYSKKNFVGDKADLGPGQGVDILTEEGRRLTAAALFLEKSNTLRFSVEWADVMNEDGSFNEVAMERYVEAAKYFQLQGIHMIICLHHFVTPLDEHGNSMFESPGHINEFVSYAKYVYTKLSPYTKHFVTFNEPNVNSVENYILGDFPAGGKGNFWKHTLVLRNMLEAHRRVHREFHAMDDSNTVQVGMTHQALEFTPSSRFNYIARIVSFIFTYVFHESFMQWAEKNKPSLDFLGVQYHTKPLIGGFPPDSTCRKDQKMVDAMRFRFYPQGILPILEGIGKRLGDDIPLLVTETGTAGPNNPDNPDKADEMDEMRAEYMRQSLAACAIAQQRVNLVGWLYWGMYRNFEWPHGFNKDQDFGNYIARDGKGIRETGGAKVIQKVVRSTRAAMQAHADANAVA